MQAFLASVLDDDLYAGWVLFATTGARRGEVVGLTWSDLDLDREELRIDWTLGHIGHDMRWKRPKTQSSVRTISLDPFTLTTLRAHRTRQLEQRLTAGAAWADTFVDSTGASRSGLLWTYGDGSPIHPNTWYERFLKLSAAAGLPRIRLHDLRHTYATTVIERADTWHDVDVLSKRLGHKSISTTIDTYGRAHAAADREKAHTFATYVLGSA
jgi:integrase